MSATPSSKTGCSISPSRTTNEPWGDPWMENLQKRFYEEYLNGIRDALFEQFESIGVYKGAWTSGTLRREEVTG